MAGVSALAQAPASTPSVQTGLQNNGRTSRATFRTTPARWNVFAKAVKA